MVRTASPRLPGAASPRLDAKWRSTRSWICVKNTSLGNSGVSRPSSVIAASRQAITALIVTARSIRCPVRCPRYSTLQPDLSIRCQSSMRQRSRYHSSTCSASASDATGNVVSRNHSNASTPSGAARSHTCTSCIRSAASPRAGAGNSTVCQRNSACAVRAARSALADCRRVPRRAELRCTLISNWPPTGCARMCSNSFGRGAPRTRLCLARTSNSTPSSRRCSANSACTSASRSITATRRGPANWPATSAQSRNPRIQRKVLRCSSGRPRCACPSGASYWMCSSPSGMPSGLTASVECMCSPSVPSERLFLPM